MRVKVTALMQRLGVDVIDLAPVFRRLIFGEELAQRIMTDAVDATALMAEYQPVVFHYYLDSNHFTPEGNRVIAAELYERIPALGLLGGRPAGG